jgi:hypothetical protein
MRRACALVVVLAACSPSRDVVPDTRDVRVVTGPDGGGGGVGGGYAFVAKRPHGAIGLAGVRFMDEVTAHKIVERLGDELEACAKRLEEQGTLVEGAARYVAAGPKGSGEIGDMELAPGGAVAANALLCIVAPVRATQFPASKDGVPALLLEASWSPSRAGRAPAPKAPAPP